MPRAVRSGTMTDRPRIPPLPEADRDDRARELLAGIGLPAGADMHIFSTLVRHPRLFRRWTAFGGVLLTGELPARDRELLILRTAHRVRAGYEWAHHVEIAERAGLTAEEVERVRADPTAASWSDLEAALLRAADELHDDGRIGDATWDVLAAAYDERQLIEVPMVVGQYHLVGFTLNSLGVEIEDGYPDPGYGS
jgi:4-carboxymuconolactone decarboxylase